MHVVGSSHLGTRGRDAVCEGVTYRLGVGARRQGHRLLVQEEWRERESERAREGEPCGSEGERITGLV